MRISLLFIALAATLLAGCKGGNPAQGPTGTLVLNLSHTCGGQALGTDTLKVDSLFSMKLEKFSYIISNVELLKADGSTVPVPNSAQVVNALTNGGNPVVSLSAPVGEYKGLRFYIGLDSATNHQEVANLPQGHPLNVPEMHWSWMPAAGYKFMALEGMLFQAGNDSAKVLTYHLATDALFTRIDAAQESSISVRENQTASLNLWVELQHLFTNVSLPAERVSESMSPPHVELAKKIARNWPQMFRVTP
jgi:hypothetical protein